MPGEYAAREFFGSILQPARVAWEEARTGPDEQKSFAALAFVEAYGWTCLGVRADAFDRKTTLILLQPVADSIREANQFTAQSNLLPEVVTAENRGLLESKRYLPVPFLETYKFEFQRLPRAATVFSLWCAEFMSFERFDSSRALVRVLNFGREPAWQTAFGAMRDEPFVPNPDEKSKISYFEGYLRVLQHFDRIADLFALEGISLEEWPARAIMRLDIGPIHQWRFNFRSVAFERRFSQFTEAVEERLAREADADNAKAPRGGFVSGVRDLRNRYLAAFNPISIAKPQT
jgi:hypothetical protein